MKKKMKFLRILFPIALFSVPLVGYIVYTITGGKIIGRKHVPSPLLNLILLAIMCISLWVTYNVYKEDEEKGKGQ